MNIAKEVKTMRALLGLSQEKLAEKLDISTAMISRYETGKSMPGADKFMIIRSLIDEEKDKRWAEVRENVLESDPFFNASTDDINTNIK